MGPAAGKDRGGRGEERAAAAAHANTQTRRLAQASAAHPRGGGAAEQQMPVLQRADAYDRRGNERATGRRSRPVPRDRYASSEVCLPDLREGGAGERT